MWELKDGRWIFLEHLDPRRRLSLPNNVWSRRRITTANPVFTNTWELDNAADNDTPVILPWERDSNKPTVWPWFSKNVSVLEDEFEQRNWQVVPFLDSATKSIMWTDSGCVSSHLESLDEHKVD